MKHIFFFLLVFVFSLGIAQKKGLNDTLQSVKNDSLKPVSQNDSVKKNKYKFRLKRGELNFIVNRTFIPASGLNDTTPIISIGSGGLFLGAGYNFNINTKVALHLQPGLNFFKIRYRKTDGASFPQYSDTTSNPTLSYKRQLMTYVEVPVGVVYTFKRDEKKSRVTYVEGGAFGGFNIANTFRVKYSVADNLTANGTHNEIKKIKDIPYVNPIRYGVYARVGRGFLSLYAAYRFSNVFYVNRRLIENQTIKLVTNPKLTGLEIGLGIVL